MQEFILKKKYIKKYQYGILVRPLVTYLVE